MEIINVEKNLKYSVDFSNWKLTLKFKFMHSVRICLKVSEKIFFYYSRLRNKRRGTLNNVVAFFPVAMSLLKRYLYFFKLKFIFFLFFLQLCLRNSNYLIFQRGARLIQGAMLIVFAKCSRGYVYSRGYIYS